MRRSWMTCRLWMTPCWQPGDWHSEGMGRPPAPLPPSLPWRAFTRSEALSAGVSSQRLRRKDLYTVRPGLYAVSGSELTELDIVAALCRADPAAVVVGLSAARMQGLPLPSQNSTWATRTPVHIAAERGTRKGDRVVRWHNLSFAPGEVRWVSYSHLPAPGEAAIPHSTLRMSTRARTWRDLAPLLTHLQLVSIGDHLVRRPTPTFDKGRTGPLCTVTELSAACTGRYARKLRTALGDVRVGADSPRETMLRLAFRDAGLPEPLINQPLHGADGRVLHRPDFQWPEHRVCAEYEGKTHNDEEQVKRDIRRARRTSSAGFHEIRLYDEDTRASCANAVRIVRDELIARGWKP